MSVSRGNQTGKQYENDKTKRSAGIGVSFHFSLTPFIKFGLATVDAEATPRSGSAMQALLPKW